MTKGIYINKKHGRTKSKTIDAVRLQKKTADSNAGQETTGYDDVYDVVERFATKM